MNSIKKYQKLIEELPVMNQKSRARKDLWIYGENPILIKKYSKLIEKDFGKNEYIEISRNEIFQEQDYIIKVIKILIWGYPTGGRGNNIRNCLYQIEHIVELFIEIKDKNISKDDYQILIKKLKNIKGLGASTWTKLFYFFNIKIENSKTLIFDKQIEKSLANVQLNELVEINKLKHNSENDYLKYIKRISEISNELYIPEDNIELFLFYINLNYKL